MPTAEEAERSAIRRESTRELIQFGIANVITVIFALNKNIWATHFANSVQYLERTTRRGIAHDDVDTFSALVNLSLFDWGHQVRKKKELKNTRH
ncbi:MAG: hypothetical protein ABI217_08885 [Chthoniobacterales bacterium]